LCDNSPASQANRANCTKKRLRGVFYIVQIARRAVDRAKLDT
jgi:hypothetical protein